MSDTSRLAFAVSQRRINLDHGYDAGPTYHLYALLTVVKCELDHLPEVPCPYFLEQLFVWIALKDCERRGKYVFEKEDEEAVWKRVEREARRTEGSECGPKIMEQFRIVVRRRKREMGATTQALTT
mgnify:FL=1